MRLNLRLELAVLVLPLPTGPRVGSDDNDDVMIGEFRVLLLLCRSLPGKMCFLVKDLK